MKFQKYKLLIAILSVCVVAAAIWVTPKVLRRLDMQGLRPVTVASGLDNPWGLAFLPDGRMLVTERVGRMRLVATDGSLSEPLRGVTPVHAQGEGGLMDVVLDPDFERNGNLYWSYSEPAPAGGTGSSTAVARGRLNGTSIEDVTVIFRQESKVTDDSHFGSRLLFAPDGKLFVSLGDRSKRDDVQDLASTHGKILRLETDGRAPLDNPFVDTAGSVPQIWTLGHRNVQGLAINPTDGALWASEHGPQGGDELNVIERGHNYGWPVVTYGCEYVTCAKIGEGTYREGMEQPVTHWSPAAIAPTGMVFLTSERYPGWKGNLFLGMLQGRAVLRLKLDGNKVVEQQYLLTGLMDRVRNVRQGPDGWLYILVGRDEGRIIRIEQ